MLPGFNHNIRYKDRVFHVQTEDNGIQAPRLITQVFIDGHVLALEKSSYQDILEQTVEAAERTNQIRNKMQDQHRRLLKNLVQGAYDERINLYLTGPRSNPGGSAVLKPLVDLHIPKQALAEAEDIPMAPEAIGDLDDGPTTSPPAPLGEAQPSVGEAEEWKPLSPEDLIEIEEPIEVTAAARAASNAKAKAEAAKTEEVALKAKPRSNTPTPRTDDLHPPPISKPHNKPLEPIEHAPGAVARRSDVPGTTFAEETPAPNSEFLSVLDEEMRRQLPWVSSEASLAAPPPLRIESNPGNGPRLQPIEEPAPPAKDPASAASNRPAGPNFKDARRNQRSAATPAQASDLPKMKAPPASDTLVDFGLPASLREQLAANLEARKREAKSLGKDGTPGRRGGVDARVARFRMAAPSAPSRGRRDEPGASSPPQGNPFKEATEAPNSPGGAMEPEELRSVVERQTLIDMELRKAASDPNRNPSRAPIGSGADRPANDTMLEVDARALHARIAEQRAALHGGAGDPDAITLPPPPSAPLHQALERRTEPRPATPKPRRSSGGVRVTPVIQGEGVTPPKDPPAQKEEERSSILVVERSLDEVILSYLSDEQD